jgi:hypothetical protein
LLKDAKKPFPPAAYAAKGHKHPVTDEKDIHSYFMQSLSQRIKADYKARGLPTFYAKDFSFLYSSSLDDTAMLCAAP